MIHQHDHPIAGLHYDLRLQINETSSASWAIMYALPGDPIGRGNRNATVSDPFGRLEGIEEEPMKDQDSKGRLVGRILKGAGTDALATTGDQGAQSMGR